MATAQQHILNRYSKVTVIGAGVIGASWTALFLAHGLAVVVNDPRPDVETIVRDYIRNNLSTLKELGLPTDNLEKKLSFEADLERSVAGADLVQENGPERIEFKQDLWGRIGKVVGEHALMLSSSSAKTATEQALEIGLEAQLLFQIIRRQPKLIERRQIVADIVADDGLDVRARIVDNYRQAVRQKERRPRRADDASANHRNFRISIQNILLGCGHRIRLTSSLNWLKAHCR